MHRHDLLAGLRSYRERWPGETAVADRLICFVEGYSNCFERSLQIGHITGSAWLVNRAGTHVLLTHHRKLGMWLQLGGHADGNPDIFGVAKQEAVEESGIRDLEPVGTGIFDIDIHLIPERKAEPAHHHYDIRFVFQCPENEMYVVGDESHDLAWVKIELLKTYTSEESMLRMARKWLNR